MVLAAFSDFMQQVVSGLASGGIYSLLALALVIIHRSTGVINFAQGRWRRSPRTSPGPSS